MINMMASIVLTGNRHGGGLPDNDNDNNKVHLDNNFGRKDFECLVNVSAIKHWLNDKNSVILIKS